MNNGEGMPQRSQVGQSGKFGIGLGWQGAQVDFEVKGSGPWDATAWDEDICVAAFSTRSRLVLVVRLWLWHFRFNRKRGAS